MIDPKVKSLLTLIECKNYTKAAKQLHLTQPAVSHQIRQLEEEFQIKIFHKSKRNLILTPEGEILVKYAHRMMAVYHSTHQALEDARNHMHRFVIATTPTAGEYYIPQLLAAYCSEHSDVHINLITDSINNIYNKLKLYEADFAIIDGRMTSDKYHSILLDTDYLCLIVAVNHPLAHHSSVQMSELRQEKFILRSKEAGTREIFETYLESQRDSIQNYRILIETDSLATIKELVMSNMGVSIMSHNACVEDEQKGRLKTIPITNSTMIREINLVYPKSFEHIDVLLELKKTYSKIHK